MAYFNSTQEDDADMVLCTLFEDNFINKIQMETGQQITLKFYLETVKKVALNANNLEQHKRRLSQTVNRIQQYAGCFKSVDLDKKGVIYPKVMQNFLIKHKYYFDPKAISRLYSKYSHQKRYLNYQDLLEVLMPHQDYILISNTISNDPQPSKFIHSCTNERLKSIQHFTAFILQLEIKYLTQEYDLMLNVTKNSQRVGATLWRLLDRNHNNSLSFEKVLESASQFGVVMSVAEWMTYLYWQFHSYKKTISRNDFMRILDVQEQRKRATSACQIDQFKLQQQIYKRAEEDRLRTIRIEKAVMDKLNIAPLLSRTNYQQISQEEHFPFEALDRKKVLKGKLGYSRPKDMVKYSVQRFL